MVEIISTEFQQRKKQRNKDIAAAFKKQKKAQPGAPNADCIRGLSANFEVSEATVRSALKEEGLL